MIRFLHIKKVTDIVELKTVQMVMMIGKRAGVIKKSSFIQAVEMDIQKIVILKQIQQKMLLLKMDF